MKKLFLTLAVAAMTAQTMNAQTVYESKNFDNWYIGINGGASVMKTSDFKFKNTNFQAGIRVGRWFTPVVGLVAEGQVFFGKKSQFEYSKTGVKASNISILGTLNFSNWFGGYPGTPRGFEVIGIYGLGWEHMYGVQYPEKNALSSKVGLDLALNFGSDKQWQLYLEPALVYTIADAYNKVQYNLSRSLFQLNLGLNYKFGNSNGTHNFKIAELRDQAEIDGLNAKINELRADVNSKDGQIAANAREIADLKAKLAACEARPVQTIVEEKKENILQPMVIFRQGKSTIDAAQYASIEMVAKYMRNHKDANVIVRGFASPEGNAELNQKLSEKRAEAVKNALIKRYKISKDRITTQGLGATDKISEENDFNRVAMFIDTTK